jgi:type II secretory pathway pseudopilin PulG
MFTVSIKPDRDGVQSEMRRHGEGGYALIALIAMMSIMMLLILAATPNIRHQTQREREMEAIFRGEEVAEAIRRFVQASNGQLPTSMDQLLEGVPRGTKKVQILRPAAAKDPLSESGEWRLIRLNDPALLKFQIAVTLYAGGRTPISRDPFIQKYTPNTIKSITNIGSNDDSTPAESKDGSTKDDSTKDDSTADDSTANDSTLDESEEASGGEDTSTNSTGPFIGVASRSRSDSIITYYGIERHNRWVFTPLFR